MNGSRPSTMWVVFWKEVTSTQDASVGQKDLELLEKIDAQGGLDVALKH